MGVEEVVRRYRESRERFRQRLGTVGGDLDGWIEKHRHDPPTVADLAHFEGLRAGRARLLAEFKEVEDRFVIDLLQHLTSESPGTRRRDETAQA